MNMTSRFYTNDAVIYFLNLVQSQIVKTC